MHHHRLEEASSAVTRATRSLVNAAQAAGEANATGRALEAEEYMLPQNATQQKALVMDQQVSILKLENELQVARKRLARLRETQYQ